MTKPLIHAMEVKPYQVKALCGQEPSSMFVIKMPGDVALDYVTCQRCRALVNPSRRAWYDVTQARKRFKRG